MNSLLSLRENSTYNDNPEPSVQDSRLKWDFVGGTCSLELENQDGPPGVDQHGEGEHPKGHPLPWISLLVADTPVLHDSLEFISGSFRTSKVMHDLISFEI
jgi:hypothetical protein